MVCIYASCIYSILNFTINRFMPKTDIELKINIDNSTGIDEA